MGREEHPNGGDTRSERTEIVIEAVPSIVEGRRLVSHELPGLVVAPSRDPFVALAGQERWIEVRERDFGPTAGRERAECGEIVAGDERDAIVPGANSA